MNPARIFAKPLDPTKRAALISGKEPWYDLGQATRQATGSRRARTVPVEATLKDRTVPGRQRRKQLKADRRAAAAVGTQLIHDEMKGGE